MLAIDHAAPRTVMVQDVQMKKRREESEAQVEEIGGIVSVAGARMSSVTVISNSDPVPKKVWRKKKAHGPADTAGLASAEIAH